MGFIDIKSKQFSNALRDSNPVAVCGKRSFLSKESDTLRSYRVYISPTM